MADRPNFIIIMADQLQAGLRAGEGYALDTMPTVDRLASEGVSFDRAYTACPICCAARVSMLTGRYASAHRVRDNHCLGQEHYRQDLLDVLHAGGYVTALCGKNHSHLRKEDFSFARLSAHLGADKGFEQPEHQAFDDYLKTLRFIYDPNPAPFDASHQLPYRNVSDALTFLDGVGDRPFFLWLSFAEPHNPYQVPYPYYDMFPPEALPPVHTGPEGLAGKPYAYAHTRAMWEKLMGDQLEASLARSRSNYMGMLRLMDDQIARLDEGLQARGLNENTHLIFLSDHGDFVGEYGMMRKGPQLAEPLCRIPLVWRGPGVVQKQGATHAFANLVDILPTLCDLAGLPCPEGVEGCSLGPVLHGQAEHVAEDAYSEIGFGGLFWGPQDDGLTPEAEGALRTEGMPLVGFDCLNTWTQCGFSRTLWWENWKLVLDMNGSVQLYDIQADPFETKNLAEEKAHAPIRSELLRRLLLRMQAIQRD